MEASRLANIKMNEEFQAQEGTRSQITRAIYRLNVLQVAIEQKLGIPFSEMERVYNETRQKTFNRLLENARKEVQAGLELQREIEKESWRLFTETFTPTVGDEAQTWDYRIVDPETRLKSPKLLEMAKENLDIVDSKALENPQDFKLDLISRLNNKPIETLVGEGKKTICFGFIIKAVEEMIK